MKEFGDGFDGVTYPRLLISWRKLQLSPFTHCPLASHCQKSPSVPLYTLFCPLIRDHGVLLKFSISAPKILISNFLLDTSFHHSFQSVIIKSCFLLMNLPANQRQNTAQLTQRSFQRTTVPSPRIQHGTREIH